MTTTTFSTPGTFTYTVPAGATFLRIQCYGASGTAYGGGGGKGGYATGNYVVAPGTVLVVNVGGCSGTVAGGFNGGGAGGGVGNAGGGGGGASDVRTGTPLSSRIIVAGGGGGGGGRVNSTIQNSGGYGGGTSGHSGYFYGVGAPGTQTSGYAQGQGGPGLALGGAPYYAQYSGGGAGGGFWGGTGGTFSTQYGGGGGGGGSGMVSTYLFNGAMSNNARTGNGLIYITSTNTAPYAPIIDIPPGGTTETVAAGSANKITWTFKDPDPGDSQSAANFQYKPTGGSWTQVLLCSTSNQNYTIPASTLTAGVLYEVQVQTYDLNGALSPWSSSSWLNVVASIPAATITNPVNASNQYFSPVEVDWTLPTGGQITQSAYEVFVNSAPDNTGTMYYDSGVVYSTSQSAMVPLESMSGGSTDYINVTYLYGTAWASLASIYVISQVSPPATPLVTLSQPVNTDGSLAASVLVEIVNPTPTGGQSATTSNDIWRNGVRVATGQPPNQAYLDATPPAGPVIYLVNAFAANGTYTSSY